MMQKSSFPALAALLLLCLFSCTKDKGDENPNQGGNNTAGPLFTEVRSVMQTHCATAGCHAGSSPQSGINFSDNSTIVAQKARIKLRAVDNAGTPAQMPPPPRAALSAADQKKITDWIGAGGRLND